MKRDFSSLTNKPFDLLVCGGGIYGAWTVYDAALRGLKVALVEQSDWAGATSSASTKLIHGGLRYLESLDIKLVKKALAERQMLLSVAPHRVWPLRFGVPVYADSRIGTLQLKAGLAMYDFLADNLSPDMTHHHLDAEAFAGHFSFLGSEGLKCGFTYADAQTDDARLVLELVSGAMAAGAVCVNYCRLTRMTETDGRASGAVIEDQLTHTSAEISARQIVNTTGRWIFASAEGRDWCQLDKGIHLVMPPLPTDEAVLLTTRSDGRVFFMIPWYGMTLLGTTDSDYTGDLDHITVEPEEIDYLLAAANHYLKTGWAKEDVVGSYAGLRVMKHSDKSLPSSVSRDWEMKTAGNGVHYSIGGKITSSREDAAHIVDAVCAQLGIDAPCATRHRTFPWAPEADYTRWFVAASTQATQLGIDTESAQWLIRRHGNRTGEVLRIVESAPHLAGRIVPALPLIHADLLFCARSEMAIHLDDLLRRRMPLLILARLGEETLRQLAETVATAMDWDEAAINREIEACRLQ